MSLKECGSWGGGGRCGHQAKPYRETKCVSEGVRFALKGVGAGVSVEGIQGDMLVEMCL